MEEERPEMSLEELKSHIYTNLHQSGTLNGIKAQLRSSFLQKLRQKATSPTSAYVLSKKSQWTLDQQILHSIFINYLEHHEFQHTLSVFLPESNMKHSILSRENILKALRFDKEAKYFTNMMGLASPHEVNSLAHEMIQELSSRLGIQAIHSSTQTADEFTDHRFLLDDQLRRVESMYLMQAETQREDPTRTLEERMHKYQRDCDELSKQQLHKELEYFREKELAAMKSQERRSFQTQIDKLRKEMQAEYAEKVKKLQDRRQDLELEFTRKTAEVEAVAFDERQRILSELESVRLREENLRKSTDSNNRKFSAEDQRLRDFEYRLLEREKEAQELVEQAKRQSAQQVARIKTEMLAACADREADSSERLSKAQALERQLKLTRHTLDAELEEHERLKQKVIDQSNSLTKYQQHVSSLKTENERLGLELVSDRKTIEESKLKLQEYTKFTVHLQTLVARHEAEIDLLRKSVDAAKEAEIVLKDQLIGFTGDTSVSSSRGLPKVRALQQELDCNRLEFQKREQQWWEERREICQRLNEAELKLQRAEHEVEDKGLQIKSMQYEITNLREMLAQAQTAMTALDIRRRPPRQFYSGYSSPGYDDVPMSRPRESQRPPAPTVVEVVDVPEPPVSTGPGVLPTGGDKAEKKSPMTENEVDKDALKQKQEAFEAEMEKQKLLQAEQRLEHEKQLMEMKKQQQEQQLEFEKQRQKELIEKERLEFEIEQAKKLELFQQQRQEELKEKERLERLEEEKKRVERQQVEEKELRDRLEKEFKEKQEKEQREKEEQEKRDKAERTQQEQAEIEKALQEEEDRQARQEKEKRVQEEQQQREQQEKEEKERQEKAQREQQMKEAQQKEQTLNVTKEQLSEETHVEPVEASEKAAEAPVNEHESAETIPSVIELEKAQEEASDAEVDAPSAEAPATPEDTKEAQDTETIEEYRRRALERRQTSTSKRFTLQASSSSEEEAPAAVVESEDTEEDALSVGDQEFSSDEKEDSDFF